MSRGNDTGGRSLRNGNLGFAKLSLRKEFCELREKSRNERATHLVTSKGFGELGRRLLSIESRFGI